GWLAEQLGAERSRWLLGVYRANARAMAAYRPESTFCDVTLVAAEVQRDGEADPRLGWDRLVAGGGKADGVQGDHHTMMRPPAVDRLADILRAVLDGRGAP